MTITKIKFLALLPFIFGVSEARILENELVEKTSKRQQHARSAYAYGGEAKEIYSCEENAKVFSNKSKISKPQCKMLPIHEKKIFAAPGKKKDKWTMIIRLLKKGGDFGYKTRWYDFSEYEQAYLPEHIKSTALRCIAAKESRPGDKKAAEEILKMHQTRYKNNYKEMFPK